MVNGCLPLGSFPPNPVAVQFLYPQFLYPQFPYPQFPYPQFLYPQFPYLQFPYPSCQHRTQKV